MRRIVDHVLDDFARDHKIEVVIGIRKRVALGIEVIDLTMKVAIGGIHRFPASFGR